MADEKYSFEEKVNYILGIVSIVGAFFNPLLGLVAGIVGFNFSKKDSSAMSKKAKKLCTIGIAISIIVLFVYAALAGLAIISELNSAGLGL